tara:strand:+ start:615 stop:1448 length:834 start_codon:yes stop_codon:yes gene_type:complete
MKTSTKRLCTSAYTSRSALRGFTLIEILVVVMIIGIFATLAVYNLTGYMNFQQQSQTHRLIEAAISDLRTFCMSSSFDTSNNLVWQDGKPTRLGCGFYIYRGWTNPDNPIDASGTWADGVSNFDHSVSYSLLLVKNSGHENVYTQLGADSTLDSRKILADMPEGEPRPRVINLPEAVILKFADDGDTENNAVGGDLPDVSWVSFDTFGRLVSRQGAGGVSDSSTSSGFSGKDRYVALVYATGDSDQSSLAPLYVDLRNGGRVRNSENIGSLNFGTFN